MHDCNAHDMIWQSGISLARYGAAKHKCPGTSEVQRED
jgi:hypothetical protein